MIRSALVDIWSSQQNFTNNDVVIEDALFQISFTKPETRVRNLNVIVEESILWQFSISGNYSSGSERYPILTVNFFDSSYDKPSIDVFDTSMCLSSEDYELLPLLLPGSLSGVDSDYLRNSIRSAIVNYTGIYPLQVGNIKVCMESDVCENL